MTIGEWTRFRWLGVACVAALLTTATGAVADPDEPNDAPESAPESSAPESSAPETAPRDTPEPAAPEDCPPNAFCEGVTPLPPEEADPAPIDEPGEPAPSDVDELPPSSLSPTANLSEHDDWAPIGKKAVPTPITDTGAVIFAIGYGPALLVGLIGAAIEEVDDDDTSDGELLLPLLLPVAGPPITGAITDPSNAMWGVLLADAAVQAVGLVILSVGIASEDDDGGSASGAVPQRARVLPYVTGDGKRQFSAGLSGVF